MEPITEQKTIIVENVLDYYGDINLNILREVLHFYPNTTTFTFYGNAYGITEQDMYKICTCWSKVLRG